MMGFTMLSTALITMTPYTSTPIPDHMAPITIMYTPTGTHARGEPMMGTRAASTTITDQSTADGTPKIQNARSARAPWTTGTIAIAWSTAFTVFER